MAELLLFAAFASAQTNSTSFLRRVQDRAKEQLSRLPDYTCLETIDRFHRSPGRNQKLEPVDSVHLEVLFSGGHELFGRPGDRELDEPNPVKFIGGGMIANGLFALFVQDILIERAARFTDRGEESINGAPAHRLDYELPRSLAHQEVSLVYGSGRVGLRGALWADHATGELLRLEIHAYEVPPYLPLALMDGLLDYAPMQIGDRAVFLPQEASLHVVETIGEENYNRFSFTHCSQFHAQSVLSFDVADVAPTAAPARPSLPTLPALLRVPIRLTTRLVAGMAVGEAVVGEVTGNVDRKGSVAIPQGAVVHGRIRRLEPFHGGGPSGFIVGVEFNEVDLATGPARFYADLIGLERAGKIRQQLPDRVRLPTPGQSGVTETLTIPELPGVAAFFVPGASPSLPAPMVTVWRTRGPLR